MSAYRCALCNGNFEFHSIRYSSDGKRIVCKDCYSEIAPKIEKTEVRIINIGSPKVKIICKKCRYKFSYNKNSKISLICPYCGGYELMRDETNAQKLLEEVSSN